MITSGSDFGIESSLPILRAPPVVTHNTTRLFLVYVSMREYEIHADAIADYWLILESLDIFPFSVSYKPSLLEKPKAELAIKLQHPNLTGTLSNIKFLLLIRKNTHTHTHTHTHIYIYIYIYTYIYTNTYIYIYIYTYAYMYIHI